MIFEIVEKTYRDMLYERADDKGCIFYFSSDDFDGLNKKAYPFKSSLGHDLSGYLYWYDKPIKKRLVIFDHGIGSGHRGYMREIEVLAKHGYLVFAYDHTGCMESGGETTGGFSQSLMDLDDAVKTLKKERKLKKYQIYVVGHSWGAFSTLNIAALHPEIKKTVAISGFTSLDRILKQYMGGPLAIFRNKLYKKELEASPIYAKFDAIQSLKKTKAKVLIIHSDDDKTVKPKLSFDLMKKKLKNKKNITFVEVTGKDHNPNYTEEAVKYKDEFFATYKKALKKKIFKTDSDKKAFKDSFDWYRMTEQDEDVWNIIFEHLDK